MFMFDGDHRIRFSHHGDKLESIFASLSSGYDFAHSKQYSAERFILIFTLAPQTEIKVIL